MPRPLRSLNEAPSRRAVPTERGVWVGVLATTLFVAGLVAEASALMALGALTMALLAAAWFLAELIRHELGDSRIAFWSHDAHRGEDTPTPTGNRLNVGLDRPFVLSGLVSLPATVHVSSLDLEPGASESLSFDSPTAPPYAGAEAGAPGSLPPATTQTWVVKSQRIGEAFIHGATLSAEVALGLFRVSTWVRSELTLQTLPARLISRSPGLTATRAVNDSQAELVHRDKRGFGMEIRELRDFVPGDPFKHIAWRATARRGKLIAREFESDLSLSVWLCLDVSPSMWWGPPGAARIDHVVEIACDLGRVLSAGRDKVGLVVHDHTTRITIEPGRGPLHYARILNALLEVPHLVFEDMTEMTDRELVERVARWWQVQRRTSFASAPRRRPPPPRPGPPIGPPADARPLPRQSRWDIDAMVQACRDALDEARRIDRANRPVVADAALAVDANHALLRAFCRRFGIPISRDPTPRPGGQAHGLEAALASVLAPHSGKKSSAHTIVMLSDLHTADDHDALRRIAITARRHRHSLVFLQPTGERGVLPTSKRAHAFGRADQLLAALLEVQELRAEESARKVQAILRPAGASFLAMLPGDSVARVLSRLEAMT